MLKVLIVEDSALMRRQLRRMLEAEGDIEVALARNGVEALEQIAAFQPQVVTLDVNMPEMDGLTCLGHIMRDSPRPVLMVSSITEQGSDAAVRALALGAVDVMAKPDGTVSVGLDRMRDELLAKLRAAARARPRRALRLRDTLRAERAAAEQRRAAAAAKAMARGALGLTLIGVSTGGPRTLEEILPELPASYPQAIVVAQHMPAGFTASFARRLDGICEVTVTEVNGPVPLAPGHVYIGRGEADVVVERRLGRLVANSVRADDSLWHPSVNRLVHSALGVAQAGTLIGVQLTGMGDDGAEAMALLRARGGRTIAESEETAAVFGMPAELIRRGGATEVMNCDRIAARLLQWTGAEVRRWGS
ncbi:chemotaxis-specific protein-glutamate methyltransferase CheB [Paracraurococcus lichenis]|uniref:Protein-glutamate methylesterase/protein-glutamine glutaminase n=1 Tax=Paracraurococcus lichenis TaxID=3064888 RepID=A0ABT9E691_9PROT|nr:chemotaxis-specific protein-glutamate methyltransferase CheB [Paracraurococcus sp. LOR1-02]MDO9711694.1 chemotaxis-specific protein-glutamate methyltransferase CheB [Paracraurococcus sp. LOR1-02]